ncbi:MAG: UDP-2,3-diacylglucosamine diphosphatase LpxG [Waddliaceae bacterium]
MVKESITNASDFDEELFPALNHPLFPFIFFCSILSFYGMKSLHIDKKKVHTHTHFLWDVFCFASVIGIWPRFIEPAIITTTKLTLPIPDLPEEMENFTLLQISDLHFHRRISDGFLDKIIKKSMQLKPDVIVFTGDFLCESVLEDEERLCRFLNRFYAPCGCFAILGNHDYEKRVSLNDRGDYDIVDEHVSPVRAGFKRLFSKIPLTSVAAPEVCAIKPHQQLINVIRKTPFDLLDNQTRVIPIAGSALNLCGVGEHMLGRCRPDIAFQHYDLRYPGVILAHNPDCIPKLKNYPGHAILCGHTHGCQVNLPWLRETFTLLENPAYKRGFFKVKEKWVYVNRGLGSTFRFRWFSLPELLFLTWKRGIT